MSTITADRSWGQEQARYRPAGFALLFTGLPGSGRSSIARALRATVVTGTGRAVSLLDGAGVKAGLGGLSASSTTADEDLRMTAYVAEQIVQHGGIAFCVATAPSDSEIRAFTDRLRSVGEILVVDVSTPWTTCADRGADGGAPPERRPVAVTEADVVVDTTGLTVAEATQRVMAAVAEHGLWSRVR